MLVGIASVQRPEHLFVLRHEMQDLRLHKHSCHALVSHHCGAQQVLFADILLVSGVFAASSRALCATGLLLAVIPVDAVAVVPRLGHHGLGAAWHLLTIGEMHQGLLVEATLLDDIGGQTQHSDFQKAQQELRSLLIRLEVLLTQQVQHRDKDPAAGHRLQWLYVGQWSIRRTTTHRSCHLIKKRHGPEEGNIVLVHETQVKDESAECGPIHAHREAGAHHGSNPQAANLRQELDLGS
mmetsp:Transcript_64682/g.142708  ORF Transcript_64682/g.142708 Transcript_64682/m.142708 type:complete len:238 (-) Transcript_64682:821-1534(-)